MVEFRFISRTKEKLASLSYLISAGFAGWDSFADNRVLVADPVECAEEDPGQKETNLWSMSAYIGPDNAADSIVRIDLDVLGDQFRVCCVDQEVCDVCSNDNFNCNNTQK